MDTTLSYPPLSKVKISFVWYLPLFCLGLTGAYILASTVFPVTIGKDKILGFALSQEQTFNQPLFVHLTAGIFFIALAHLITRIIGVKMSTGNAILALLLTVNIFCFVIGINIPMLNTTKLWIIKEHLSLTQVLSNLKVKGEIQLYYIMLSMVLQSVFNCHIFCGYAPQHLAHCLFRFATQPKSQANTQHSNKKTLHSNHHHRSAYASIKTA
jgi:hypothetical protein